MADNKDLDDLKQKSERELLLKLTTDIVVAKISGSFIEPDDLSNLVSSIYHALAGQCAENDKSGHPIKRQQPAVPIKKSVYPDYVICLEDGKKLKMLKRHIKSNYDLTPDQYREKWGLPPEYPLVAPNYAKRRSELARNIGLGRSGKTTTD